MWSKYWNSFVSVAASLGSLFSGFLVAVPTGPKDTWFQYGKFLIAICIGLWFVPERVWGRRTNRWHWWSLAVVLAICSSFCVFRYAELVNRWTTIYYNKRVVVGDNDQLVPRAQAYLDKLRKDRPSATQFDVLRAALGDTAQVWRAAELESRSETITLLYLLTLFLLTSTVVTVSQAAYCASKNR